MTTNARTEELNRQHAKQIARERAVAEARTPAEAAALAEQHAREDAAEAANAEAYRLARQAEHKRQYHPARKAPAKGAKSVPLAATGAPAPASKPALPAGVIAAQARGYIDEQAKLGKTVSAAEAVAHVTKTI